MYPINAIYRSFASLRMTWIQFIVILSEAKDLYVSLKNVVDRESFCTSSLYSHFP